MRGRPARIVRLRRAAAIAVVPEEDAVLVCCARRRPAPRESLLALLAVLGVAVPPALSSAPPTSAYVCGAGAFLDLATGAPVAPKQDPGGGPCHVLCALERRRLKG